MASISSTSSTTSTSYNRITGLATGLDTDAMVKQAMQAYQTKVDQAKQARDLQIFKQTLYRDSIKDLRSLFTKYTDIAKADSLLLTKNYGTSKFTSTDENAVTAEGLAGAKIGNYKVKVESLAKPARVEVGDLESLKGKVISVAANGKSVDIDLTNASDIIATINAKMKNAGVEAKVSKSDLSGKFIFETSSTGSSQDISVAIDRSTTSTMGVKLEDISGKNVTFNINGTEVKLDLTTSLDGKSTDEAVTILQDMLTDKKITVSKGEDDKLVFQFKSSGSANIFSLSEDTAEDGPKSIANGTPVTSEASELKGIGEKAKVEITDSYGNTDTNEYDSNTFIIDNVKFTVADVTSSAVSIVGKNDATALKDKLVEFVNDYNKVIESITTKLNEKKDLNYKPLTDSQRESMTDDQIEKWETKVKQGLLKRDNDLTQITSDLRRAFTDSIQGTGLTLKQLGIDFSSDTTKAGQLVIDEDKLTTSLEQNADEIVNLFAKSAPSNLTNKSEIYNNSGIFQRIKTILNNSVMTSASTFLQRVGYEGTATYSDNDMTDDLLKREKQIKLLETNLKSRETKLYQKYATLEKIMNNYNAQSSWLTQQFSS
ncbi:flagellar filament capping protein FliD [Clostridium sp. UBA1652]|uniref:flagellar filament capping protein FliD n=1 Tax=Clostridium sp. UBA1652 TaxID=1946348 RepID=UPI00257B815B|nr:flagellar filament capping protein FliD [Clostridium sp. UBA1652]